MSVPAHRRPVSWLETVRAVLWSFLGLRRRADFERDVQRLNPIAVMATAVVLTVLFVVLLMLIVHWVVASS
ncbi:MAG: DUF2970 domain-containing protein [Tepidimonas sp.]|uniref:DUF2970 domain-containing protein n=1 Tax=Tepidimonas sp. TaxID=2002775 RepID=UPI00298EF3C7|nr:DUF2970 domain-containing protein [Tepidimonas sp.]MCS6809765.1 DUF2970 domain-containing protein [Tepidimonas sp.]MDW8337078.1 DUF2970 domain-containing protein [Tepidimonas sp.]